MLSALVETLIDATFIPKEKPMLFNLAKMLEFEKARKYLGDLLRVEILFSLTPYHLHHGVFIHAGLDMNLSIFFLQISYGVVRSWQLEQILAFSDVQNNY